MAASWQENIEDAHVQLLAWLQSIGSANGWSSNALALLAERAEEARDDAGWFFPDAQDYWDAVAASVEGWPAASGLSSSSLPGWDGFLATVSSATGAALTAVEAATEASAWGVVTGTVSGSLDDAAAISETVQEAIVDPGSSPLAYAVGGLLVVGGLFGVARLMGR